MKFARLVCAGLSFGLCVACGDSAVTGDEQATDVAAVEEAGGAGIDMAQYGYIDGRVVSPIAMPDWVPANIKLPDDFVPVEELHLAPVNASILRGITREPLEGLFDTIAGDLTAAGYEVRDSDDYRADNLVYFAGNGYADSTIRMMPGENDTLLELSLIPAN